MKKKNKWETADELKEQYKNKTEPFFQICRAYCS